MYGTSLLNGDFNYSEISWLESLEMRWIWKSKKIVKQRESQCLTKWPIVYWLQCKNRAKTPAKIDRKVLGLNPSKSNRFQIGQARYPRPKDRTSLQSDMEVQIHVFTGIGTVIASRISVWKITQKTAFNIRDGGNAKKMSIREFRAYRGI